MAQRKNTNNEVSVRVFALGGLDENGKNMYCIETVDSIFIIEAGSKYPDVTNPGVDIIIPDMGYLKARAKKVKAIIISHGHDDEYGALPYLLKFINAPIYTTETAKTFIMADYGKKYGKKFNFHIIKPSDNVVISGYRFQFFETTHAVMESFGFSVETAAGNIVYTGDYISDFGSTGNFRFDLNKVAQIADEHSTLLMMCESTGANKPGIASPSHKVTPHIKKLIEEGNSRVIIAAYSQNLYAINEIINLGIKNHKKLCLTNFKFIDVLPNFIANGDLIIPRANQCAIQDLKKYKPEDVIVLVTGQGEELYDDIEDLARGENKNKQFLQLNPTDTIVLACPPVATIEKRATAAIDSLYKTGVTVINLNKKVLSSMHAQQEDIKMMLSLFRPKYFMPVEGDFTCLMANSKVAKSIGYNDNQIFLVDNGMGVGFDAAGNALPVTQLFKPGNVFVDGLGVGDVKSDTIEERQEMAEDGVVILAAVISSKEHKVISKPNIQFRGFIYSRGKEEIVKKVEKLFNTALDSLVNQKKPDIANMTSRLSDNLRRELKRATGKKPLICPMIVNIDD